MEHKMETSSLSSSNRRPWHARHALVLAAAAAGVAAAYLMSGVSGGAAAQSRDKVSLKDMPSVTGAVEAAKPFKAAQVYLRNTDRRMSYMVYTQAGKFRAVALLPGNYEIHAEARGLQSDVQKLVIRSGDNPQVKISLRDAANAERFPGAGSAPSRDLALASYDEIYPPGAGKRVLEEVCMTCHGENFVPMRPRSAAGWQGALDLMMGRGLHDRDRTNPYEGILSPPATNFRFGLQDRKDLLEYLVKNFGSDSKPRAVRPETEMPLDEAKLGRAQYIEYFLTPDASRPAGGATGQPQGELAASRNRILYTIQLDAQGNAWGVDRSDPNRLVKLDPRTGEQQDFVLPDPKAGVHEILIDRQGMIWVPELGGTPGTRVYRLLGFNPKTEKWEKVINADPDDVIRNPNKVGMHASVIDSKGNIYMNWFGMGAIGRYDRETGRVDVYRIPTNSAIPYGMAVDRNDNIWSALWNFGKLTKFDPTTKQWTEFTPPTYPANMRRGVGIDSKNNVWTGIYAAGNRPAKLAKLDQTTGRITEFTIPRRGSMPYEATADVEDNIWFPDTSPPVNQPVLGKFDPRDQSFAFYPKPQVGADSPKLQHTADGAVWYTARTATPGATAFGVLYPDKDRITTLGGYPLNGPPGYPFKPNGRGTN
jgi:streptogramin lyase/mono/diheme cytochrome c family protein